MKRGEKLEKLEDGKADAAIRGEICFEARTDGRREDIVAREEYGREKGRWDRRGTARMVRFMIYGGIERRQTETAWVEGQICDPC